VAIGKSPVKGKLEKKRSKPFNSEKINTADTFIYAGCTPSIERGEIRMRRKVQPTNKESQQLTPRSSRIKVRKKSKPTELGAKETARRDGPPRGTIPLRKMLFKQHRKGKLKARR